MSDSRDARRAILRSIRDNLAASAAHDAAHAALHAPEKPDPGRGRVPLPIAASSPGLAAEWVGGVPQAPVAQFRARLQAAGGQCTVVSSAVEARATLFDVLRNARVQQAAVSDSPFLHDVLSADGAAACCEIVTATSRDRMLEIDAGVSSAQWAIAESGTLVLESGVERNRLVSLLPPIHVVLVPAERLCGTLGDVLARLEPERGKLDSRAITCITGPSQTADIEQMLVKGVHGPRSLLVILVEDSRRAATAENT